MVAGDADQSLPAACREKDQRLERAPIRGPGSRRLFHQFQAGIDMKISGVDIRPGNIIEYEGGIWRAVKIQHTQPGKGGAYMQVEMKNLIDGRKTNVRFRSRRDRRARPARHQGLPVPLPRRRHARVHGQG